MTFFLGLAIGISVGYAVFSGHGKVPAPPPASEQVAENVEPLATPEHAEPPITPPSEMPVLEAEQPPPPAPVLAPPPITAKDVLASGDAVWPGRFLFIAVDGLSLDDATRAMLAEVRPGGVVLHDSNLTDAALSLAVGSQIKSAVGLGLASYNLPLLAVEQEGGASMNKLRLKDAPGAAELGRTKDVTAAEKCGRLSAEAAAERNIGIILAPVLDVAERNPKDGASPLSADRFFSADQKVVADVGTAFANGVLAGGRIPVAKYYPGVGKAQKTDAGDVYVLKEGARRLAELMYPFSEAARKGVPGILVGHVAVPAIDLQNPNRPASLSPVLVKTVLRERFKFAGVILADDVASGAIGAGQTPEQAAVAALAAGCDAALFLDSRADRIRAVCAAIQEAVNSGALRAEQLAESRRRLDAWQLRLAKLEPEPAATEPVSSPGTPPPSAAATNTGTVEAKPPEAPKPPVSELPPNATKISHKIERGETLATIAAQYKVTVGDLMTWNGLTESKIKHGLELIVYQAAGQRQAEKTATPKPETPEQTKTHVVAKGENINKIAAKYGTTAKHLLELNRLESPDTVIAGQELIVPEPFPEQQQQ